MKAGIYLARLGWFLLKLLVAVGFLAGLLTCIFQVAMHSANVYVVVTDGMKMRTTSVLTPEDVPANVELSMYFSQECLQTDTMLRSHAYDNCDITSFSYELSVDELWCQPWRGTSSMVVTESVPSIIGAGISGEWDENGNALPGAVPAWPHVQYRVDCRLTQDSWIITDITAVKDLEPVATPTKEPDITPLPATPTPETTPTPAPPPSRTLPPWPQEDLP